MRGIGVTIHRSPVFITTFFFAFHRSMQCCANMDKENLSKKPRTANGRVQLPVRFDVHFLEQCDARKRAVKLMKKRYLTLKEHTGADCIQKDILARRATFLSLLLESMEIEAMSGDPINMGSYTIMANTLTGLLRALGISKQMKNVTDLKTYLAEKEAKSQEVEAKQKSKQKSKWAQEVEAEEINEVEGVEQ